MKTHYAFFTHSFTDHAGMDGDADMRITFVCPNGSPHMTKAEIDVNGVWVDAAGYAHQGAAEEWFDDHYEELLRDAKRAV